MEHYLFAMLCLYNYDDFIVSLIRDKKLFKGSPVVLELPSPWNTPKYTPKEIANATTSAIPIIQNNKLSAQLQQLKLRK